MSDAGTIVDLSVLDVFEAPYLAAKGQDASYFSIKALDGLR